MTVRPGRIVLFPAYVCVDLIAAARAAGVKVRLYDIDPHTLSPDLLSVQHAAQEGADAIVVAHLYGFPADVPGVRAVVAEHGITVIEDAAQHAGATIAGATAHLRTGSLGDLSILSFGRGKGTTAGNGGALLALTEGWEATVDELAPILPPPGRGVGDLLGTAASWMLGRPTVYSIPASIPGLHLGETVYHEAHEPATISQAAVQILSTTFPKIDTYVAIRRRNAAVLAAAAAESARLYACTPIQNGEPGYLRFPIVTSKPIDPAPQQGIVRGYPRPLFDQPELQPYLVASTDTFAGARTLAQGLLTLPTHHLLTDRDLKQLSTWLRRA
jgi:dTDP-4-amino-4,6-dideoxygalactose transaminase